MFDSVSSRLTTYRLLTGGAILMATLSVLAITAVSTAQTTAAQGSKGIILAGELSPEQTRPVPKGVSWQRVDAGSNGSGAPPGTGVEVYRNLTGPVFASVGANQMLADDIQTIAAGGCPMDYLEVGVFGGGDGTGPGFNVTQLAIYDQCPRGGGLVIHDLLGGTPLFLPNDGLFSLSFDLTGAELTIPTDFWLGVAFDTSTAGWVGGAPAEIGFTKDLFDTPAIPCNSTFSASLYAGMNANIFCSSATTFFVGYQSNAPSGFFFGGNGCTTGGLGTCGDGVDVTLPCEAAADDITPIVPDCQLYGYSINVAGTGGPFDIEFELWTDENGVPGSPIPGTSGCFSGDGTGFLETARFEFDGSVSLPPTFWLVFMDTDGNAGPIEAGALPGIGMSQDLFAIYEVNLGQWEAGFFFGGCENDPSNACGSFQASVYCLGDEPTGACCETASGACSESVFLRDCNGRWFANENCATAPFDPPCGATACCQPDPNNAAATICEDLLPSECGNVGGDVEFGMSCSQLGDCGIPQCLNAEGDCFSGNGTIGCFGRECCNIVCSFDSFCCGFQPGGFWDSACAQTATAFCSGVAPENDACLEAVAVDVGATAYSTIDAATDGPVLPTECDTTLGTNIENDIWYQYTATGSGTLTVDLCTDTDYDSRVAIYEGCDCPATLVVGCDDDGCGVLGGGSVATVPVTAGTCYLIRVGGFSTGDSGTGTMILTLFGGPSIGACCNTDGTCSSGIGIGACPGTHLGLGTSCISTEACCLGDGTCDMLDPRCCANQGGVSQGVGSSCTTIQACCLPDGTCSMLDPLCCSDLNGTPVGDGTTCTGLEACCFSDGRCEALDPLCCQTQGGTPRGAGSICEGDADQDGIDGLCGDPCPNDATNDSDGDGICDSADICPAGDDRIDSDGDGKPDACDACPFDANDDTDLDGVCDSNDLCPGLDDRVDADNNTIPDCLEAIPTLSTWGLVVLTLLLLIAWKIRFRNRAAL